MYKYLILGAGPAGLTVARKLKDMGEDNFCILELEKTAGGLCRSVSVDNAPFDLGGGHFLDVCRPKVNEFLFRFMEENEWNKFERNSQISLHGMYINSPIEANIWQMNIDKQVEYLKSIATAGCNANISMPEKFIEWIYWKLGDKIANDYMIPYNLKMFADELNELGVYWLDKLPNVSFEETLRGCLTHRAYGVQPGHTKFYYPKNYGYGEVWLRIADSINKHIIYSATINKINFYDKVIYTRTGERYKAEKIINTIPWREFDEMSGIPETIINGVKELRSSSIETRYFSDKLDTKAHWIYYADLELPYHRILVRHNFLAGSRGYWTETREERVEMFNENNQFSYINKYAYPLNTINKPVIMENLLKWCEENDVYGIGRWGEHQHYNSDAVVEKALNLAEKLLN